MLRRDFLATTLAAPLFNLFPKKTRRVATIYYRFSGPSRTVGFYRSHKDNICFGCNPSDVIPTPICGPKSSPRDLVMIMSVFCKTEAHPVHVVEFEESPEYFGVTVSKNEDDLLHLADEKGLLQVTYSYMDF